MTSPARFPFLVVTGLSGAGKSTVLNVFEDLRFFSVDGLPASLVPKLVDLFRGDNPLHYLGLAVGMDFPHADFLSEWESVFQELSSMGAPPQIVFLEARTGVLLKRYATTRRPHPLANLADNEGLGLESAIEKERSLLLPIRSSADLVIDTSEYSVHDLRRKIQDKWKVLEGAVRGLRVHVITFGFKYGVPSEADFVFDLRFLPNPYFSEELRPKSGKDADVAEYVLGADPGKGFLARLTDFLAYLLPLFEAEGRYRVTLAIGCTGGRHRSVAVAEALGRALKNSDYPVTLEHRHLELG